MGIIQLEMPPGKQQIWLRAKGHVPVLLDVTVRPDGEHEKTVQLEPIEIVLTDNQLEFSGRVHFDTGSARLLPESSDILDEIAAVLLENKSIKKIRIEGHTDTRGSAEFNQKLSDQRAESVRVYLATAGVEEARMEAQGFGETQPISDIDDENRRVDFVILKGKAPGAEVTPED